MVTNSDMIFLVQVNQLSAVGQLVPSIRNQVGGDPFIGVIAYKDSPPPGWAPPASEEEQEAAANAPPPPIVDGPD